MGTRKSRHNRGRKPEYKDHGNAEVVLTKRAAAESSGVDDSLLKNRRRTVSGNRHPPAIPQDDLPVCAPVTAGTVTTDRVLLVKPKRVVEVLPPEWEIDSTQPESGASTFKGGKYTARRKQRGAFAAGNDIHWLAKQIAEFIPEKRGVSSEVKIVYRKPEKPVRDSDRCLECDDPIEIDGRSFCNGCIKRDKLLEKNAEWIYREYFNRQKGYEEDFTWQWINDIDHKEVECGIRIAEWRANQVEW